MMTHCIGQMIPEYFAAIGGTSGPIMGKDTLAANPKTSTLPVYFLMGEHDYWSWEPTEGNVKVTLDYWLGRNGVGSAEKPTSVKTDGRYTIHEWTNTEGIPMFRYMQTAGRAHSTLPEEMHMFWDWFKNWSRDEAQGIMYNGTAIK